MACRGSGARRRWLRRVTRVPFTLPRSSPGAEGVDPAGLSAFLDAVDAADDIELHSLMVLRHGRVIAEGWWSPYSPDRAHLLYSLSKSFTATAAGLAVAEGLLDLDAPVVSYFDEFADVTDPRSRRMLVRHLAAMASGHRAETWDRALRRDPDEPVRGFLLTPPDEEPGSIFAYNQPCTYTLAAIIQKVTGLTLVDYLTPRLFAPLGIERYGWLQHPRGRDLGFSGLHTTTTAIAHLGQLYLQRGRWNGRRLLGEEWIADATRSHVDNPDEPNPDWRQGYGFQFWMSRHGYRGDGAYGQFCLVLPEQDLVLAITADTPNMQGVLDAVWTHVVPAVGMPPVDAGPLSTADRHLAERLARAALPPVVAASEPDDHVAWAGAEFIPTPGPADAPDTLTGLRLDRTEAGWTVELIEAGGRLRAGLGTGAWQVSDRDPDAAPLAVSGGWTAAGRFRADVIFLETPHRLRLDAADGAFTARWRTVPLHAVPLSLFRVPRPS